MSDAAIQPVISPDNALIVRIKHLENELAAAREVVRQRTMWHLTHCDGESRLTAQIGGLLRGLDEAHERIVELTRHCAELEAENQILSKEIAEGVAAMLGDWV